MQASISDFYMFLSAKELYTGGALVSPSQSSLPSPRFPVFPTSG
jgi:hypothetical protein